MKPQMCKWLRYHAASEVMQPPPAELRELQLACKEVGPKLLYVQEGTVSEDGKIKCCVDWVSDHLQLLKGWKEYCTIWILLGMIEYVW